MAEITAALVKELREKSGVGMMDCKRALTENNGDIEASIDWLRAKGLSKAAKKADRVAAEGLVAIALSNDGKGMVGAAVELNAETDFVARNELFQNAARKVAQTALGVDGGVEALKAAKNADDEGEGDQAVLQDLGKKIALHVAATSPLSLSPDDLDPAAIERERAIFTEQAASSGKPPAVVEKMVEGRIRKFLEEVVLLKQAFVMNPDQTVEQLVADTAKQLGS